MKTSKTKKMLRKLIMESAREVVLEYQHDHEQKEMVLFGQIRQAADRLISMHKTAYDEAKELELIRQIKNWAMEVESIHTGTKITTNETES